MHARMPCDEGGRWKYGLGVGAGGFQTRPYWDTMDSSCGACEIDSECNDYWASLQHPPGAF